MKLNCPGMNSRFMYSGYFQTGGVNDDAFVRPRMKDEKSLLIVEVPLHWNNNDVYVYVWGRFV